MRWASDGAKRLTIGAASLFVLAGFLRLTPTMRAGRGGRALAAATPVIYVGILGRVDHLSDWRIPERDIKRPLMASAYLMILYMLVRTAKYNFFSGQDMALRHLWYAYYLPMTMIPPLQFLAALRVGRHEKRPISRRWQMMLAPAALLTAGIMTNDIHQLAFGFQSGFLDWERRYVRGPLYVCAAAWIALVLLATFAIIAAKCRASKSRRGVWMPFTALFIGAAYMVWGLTEHFAAATKVFQMPEVFCFMTVAFWEMCIQTGLIPSNIGHSDFFGVSTVDAQIVGAGGAGYRSRSAPALAPSQMDAAADGPVMIGPDTRLHSHPLRAGRIYWTDDLAAVHALNARLAEIGEELAEENQLIQVENQMKRQRARLAEQNRLYDGIARAVSPQLDQIDRLLEGLAPDAADFCRRVGHACVLSAYVKRRGNLMLIAEGQALVPAAELGHCIRESVDYLTVYGALCSFHQDARGKISVEKAMLAYDFFQAAAEAALPGMTALLARLTASAGGLTLRLSMQDASCRLPADWRRGALRGWAAGSLRRRRRHRLCDGLL